MTTILTHKEFVTKMAKYEHIKTATKESITPLEAENLSLMNEDEVLFILALNKGENVTTEILETALEHANEEIVKERIMKTLGEQNG